jgi:hypothetical protein
MRLPWETNTAKETDKATFVPENISTSLFRRLSYRFSLTAPEMAGLLAAFAQWMKTGNFRCGAGGTVVESLFLGSFKGDLPFVSVDALEMAGRDFKMASLNPQTFAVKEGIRHLLTGGSQYPLEGGPGDVHLFRPLLLLQAFQVFQAESFQLFYGKTDRFQLFDGNTRRLEITGFREKAYPPAFSRSGHTASQNIMDIRS